MFTRGIISAAAFVLASSTLVHGAVYTVGVGKDETTGKLGLGFDPSSIRPAAGDTIEFLFNAGDHVVIQTTFANPCSPMDGGYNSGVQSVAAGTPVDSAGSPTTTFAITSTDPLYFYDGAPNQCHLGGVFTVNPPISGDGTAAQFLEKAKSTPEQASTSASPTPTSSAPAAATSSAAPSASASANSAVGSFATGSGAALAVAGIFGALFSSLL
ncbi:hypothetical protein M407DRAFT_240517 [Tulasnella calospora MUT 4182]|uniref:Phytocyanin domain-containing protein n=1 Tax=Tulasnella calospora MUT 4182 TaxID=1051891 RepID=A0A0C3QXB2_9AGAM|nr:hypothetical protein M407DRAFT_240517 [Tulasnella calospora MUT 4182]